MKKLMALLVAVLCIAVSAFALTGCQAKDGANGEDGKSAYQIWLDAGNTGTEQDFLNSLKGSNGSDGVDGKSAWELYLEWYRDNNDGADPMFTEEDFNNNIYNVPAHEHNNMESPTYFAKTGGDVICYRICKNCAEVFNAIYVKDAPILSASIDAAINYSPAPVVFTLNNGSAYTFAQITVGEGEDKPCNITFTGLAKHTVVTIYMDGEIINEGTVGPMFGDGAAEPYELGINFTEGTHNIIVKCDAQRGLSMAPEGVTVTFADPSAPQTLALADSSTPVSLQGTYAYTADGDGTLVITVISCEWFSYLEVHNSQADYDNMADPLYSFENVDDHYDIEIENGQTAVFYIDTNYSGNPLFSITWTPATPAVPAE